MNETTETEGEAGTGADLVANLTSHAMKRTCPGCDESIMTTGITALAYTFESCTCDVADYAHLVERIWHLTCLSDAAPNEAAADLLGDAAFTLDRYKRGQQTAERIRQFLAERAPSDPSVCEGATPPGTRGEG